MRRLSRRAFALGTLAAAAACSSKTGTGAPLVHLTAEELVARAKANGEAKKLTALHFWATWCGPCVEEFPLLDQEWQQWMRHEPRLDFLAVSVDEVMEKETAAARDERVHKFIRAQGATFPTAIALTDTPETFALEIDEGWPAVLPSTLLFGFDGKVTMRQLGELRVTRFREKVQLLLSRP